jgi:hypothetical protein
MIDKKRLRQCYKTAGRAEISMEEVDIKNPYIEDLKNKILLEIQKTKFCPPKIFQYLQKCTKCIVLRLDNICYHVFYLHLKDLPPIAKLQNSIRQGNALTMYFQIFHTFNIYLIMSPYKRCFPSVSNLISSEHINGGFTSTKENNIYILRSEEFSKVILHELLHHCPKVHNEGWT